MFARKIVRPHGEKVTEEDIVKEANTISTISRGGRNRNVVTILRHRWLPRQSDTYYIDMEYCVTTLHARIQEGLSRNRDAIPVDLGSVLEQPALEDPISQQEQENQAGAMGNVPLPSPVESISSSLSIEAGIDWASALDIIEDVASGLVYIHDQNIVHRDLKPQNGSLHR